MNLVDVPTVVFDFYTECAAVNMLNIEGRMTDCCEGINI
jgi:hypothetical protein